MCLIGCCLAIAAGYGMKKNRQKAKLLLYMLILMDINSLKLYHKEGRNATVECGLNGNRNFKNALCDIVLSGILW